MKLTGHRLGRALLHLKCVMRGGKWSWHLAGLWRELFGRSSMFIVAALLLGSTLGGAAANSSGHYSEPFRPQFHFTPEKNWMNDPNGLVFYEGEYHLFYQYNPLGNKWGHMSWGHAVSPDMVHWKHLPLAMPESDGVMIFSGSAVVDWKNTSGFGKDGKPPLIAIYTGHHTDKPLQDQNIAYSNDRGRTWTKYPGNPVLDIGAKDFRDPKVFWHQPSGRWVMAVSLPTEHKVRFYSSANLKEWSRLSDFGPAGATDGIWECPDLFPLKVEDSDHDSKWVLIVNLNPGGPAGGSGCQYFVGEFDGTNFVLAASHPQNGNQAVQSNKVITDFEGNDYGAWKISGTAFGSKPAHPAGGDLTGFNGRGLADSYGGNDSNQGTLISPEFKITNKYLSFLIGGGNHPESLGVNLIVNGKMVRTATGNNSPQLTRKSWDVTEFAGRDATIEVFDHYSGSDWGHIMVDHFVLSASPADEVKEPALWLDYGPDFYAAVTWSDIRKSDGRRIVLGWMSNWLYGQDVPTSPWRSAMTVPRQLALRDTKDGWRVIQSPVSELKTLRKIGSRKFTGGSFVEAANWISQQTSLPAQLDVEILLEAIPGDASIALSIVTGADEQTVLTVDAVQQKLRIDRGRSGKVAFNPDFTNSFECPLQIRNGKCSLRLMLDTSSLELFAQDGESVLTTTFFASSASRRLALTCEGNNPAQITGIKIFPLESSMKNSCSIADSIEPNPETKKP